MLTNSQNASDFDNLRVRKISTSKLLRVRIIHVSQTFGELSCSNARKNVRTTSEDKKTADAELRRARFLLATGQQYCTKLFATHAHSHVHTVPRGFGAYRFHYICQK